MAGMRPWWPQFSLRGFLVAVAVIGVGFAAVLSVNGGWTFALGAVFQILLPISIILGINCSGSARAFWIGVLVVNVWLNLFFATENVLFTDRLKNDLDSFSQRRVEPLIVRLHQDRIDRETVELADQHATAFGNAAASPQYKQDLHQQVTNGVNRSVRTSLRRFLMILLSLGGGCLSAWAYRLRKHGDSASGNQAF